MAIVCTYVRITLMTSHISQQDRVWFLPSILIPSAYRDRALQHGSLHHSAPNIYARAFAQLKIEPGHAFLNVGSGTFWCSFNKKAPSLEREFSASRMLSCLQVPNHCRVSGGCASVDICAVACFFLFFFGGGQRDGVDLMRGWDIAWRKRHQPWC